MDEIINQARNKILPLGYKPEDYYILGNDFVLRIAKMIADEVNHIQKMNQK